MIFLLKGLYAQTLMLVNIILVSCLGVFPILLETVFSGLGHLWTQDSPMFPLTVGGNTGPYIDQGGLTLNV